MAALVLSPILIITALVSACGDGGEIQEPTAVATVRIAAPTTTIEVGQTVQLTATAHDADGAELEGRSFEWSSGITSVASVSQTGLVTGLAKGRSAIRATTDRVTGSLVISVELVPPDRAAR
jgi:uncharacterized protein YjdB